MFVDSITILVLLDLVDSLSKGVPIAGTVVRLKSIDEMEAEKVTAFIFEKNVGMAFHKRIK